MSLPIIVGIIFLSVWFEDTNYQNSLFATLSYLAILLIFDLTYYSIVRLFHRGSLFSVELTAFGAIYKYSKFTKQEQRFALFGSLLVLLVTCLFAGLLVKTLHLSPDYSTYWQSLAMLFFMVNLLPLYPTKAYLLLETYLVKSNQSSKLNAYNKFVQYFLLFCLFLSLQYGNLLIVVIVMLLSIYGVSRMQKNKFLAEFSRYQLMDVLIPKERLVCFSALLTSRKAVYLAVNSFQEFFPVLQEKKFLGLVTKSQLIKNIALSEEEYLRALLDRQQVTIQSDQSLEQIAQIFLTSNHSVLPVLDPDGNFLGLIAKDKVSEFDLIKNLEEHKQKENESEI